MAGRLGLAWGRLLMWWKENWEVGTYRCECGLEVKFSQANLRRNGIASMQMRHAHGTLGTNGQTASGALAKV